MTAITANIHLIDSEQKFCVVTIKDNDEIILDKKNIGLELSPDGSANTVWVQDKISKKVSEHRKNKIRKLNSEILVSIKGK